MVRPLQSIQYKIIHRYFPCKYQLNTWNIEDSNICTYCQEIDALSHYFVQCESVRGFWNSLKALFLRTFEFCINFTVLDILLGIPNYGKNKDIDILNFVILFAKSYIYSSKRDEMAIDFYTFLVKLKTRMVIEEYRCNIYDKHVEIETMWARLADSV